MASYLPNQSTKQHFTTSHAKSTNTEQESNISGHKQLEEMSNHQMLLTIPQVAQQLGICRAHVYTLINRGLPTIYLGRSVRVSIPSLYQWISEQEENE